ncbi:MAG: tetratricopeptide repeat protein [Pirellulales bacterium]
MNQLERIRRRQLLLEAEGYLELLMLFDDDLGPSIENRRLMAHRALSLLDTLPEQSRHISAAEHLRGQAFRAMEEYASAIEPLTAAAAAEPENIHIWLGLGWCQKRLRRLDLAIEALESALEAKPDVAILHYNLSCYLSLAGQKSYALRELARALELDADYRELVHKEHDFDPLRNDPEFRQLTAVLV